jgi:hypothetical protein
MEKPSVGSVLGGRFGLGKKKTTSDAPPPAAPATGGASGAPNSLLEMTMESNGFSTATVEDSQFAIPPGFKKVEPEMKRMR